MDLVMGLNILNCWSVRTYGESFLSATPKRAAIVLRLRVSRVIIRCCFFAPRRSRRDGTVVRCCSLVLIACPSECSGGMIGVPSVCTATGAPEPSRSIGCCTGACRARAVEMARCLSGIGIGARSDMRSSGMDILRMSTCAKSPYNERRPGRCCF